MRNAMNRRLGERYGEAWYDNGRAGFDRGALERITNARAEVARDRHRDDPHRIVAALSFGFWVSLLGPGGRMAAGHKANYEMTLWRPALRSAFPHRAPLTRRQAHRPLNALRTLRNRIAHHEPIFARSLVEDHEHIVEVAGWISSATQAWIEHHSRVPASVCTVSTHPPTDDESFFLTGSDPALSRAPFTRSRPRTGCTGSG